MIDYTEIDTDREEVKHLEIKDTNNYTVKAYKWGNIVFFGDKKVIVSREVYDEFIKNIKQGKSVKLTTYISRNNIVFWLFNGWRVFDIRSELEVL